MFGIFNYAWVGTERNGTIIFISLFLIFFQPILAWNELIMVFLIFWIFCYFFWNFLLHIGQERNGTIIFIFSLSQPLPTYFGLKWGSNRIFLIFWIFLLFFFGIFYYTSGTERNDNFYFLSFPTFSSLFWLKMKPQWYFLIFEFFCLFLELSITPRVRMERKDNFYFLSFSVFSNLFWLKMKP